nr:MAG TPA: hypothetical protein [Caudoviricetes sp.]
MGSPHRFFRKSFRVNQKHLQAWRLRLKKPRKDRLKNLKSYRMFTEFNLTRPTEKKTIKTRQKLWQ